MHYTIETVASVVGHVNSGCHIMRSEHARCASIIRTARIRIEH